MPAAPPPVPAPREIRRGVRARGTTMLERSVGLKGLVFCAALVVLVPISVCGDAASARVANPG